jgi:thiol-disulfide isomerase/thioredoxin
MIKRSMEGTASFTELANLKIFRVIFIIIVVLFEQMKPMNANNKFKILISVSVLAIILVSISVRYFILKGADSKPWLSIQSLNGDGALSIQRAGRPKPFLVHFWASWCGPCQEEFPLLIRAAPEISSLIDLELISLDEGRGEALGFLKMVGAPDRPEWQRWDKERRLAQQLGTSKLPETYLFSADGQLIRKISGPMNWLDLKNISYLKSIAVLK